MLEYLAYKRYKAHKDKKLEAQQVEATSTEQVHIDSANPSSLNSTCGLADKGKETRREEDAINPDDEQFLEKSLGISAVETPMTLKDRIATVTSQWSNLRHRKTVKEAGVSSHSESESTPKEKGTGRSGLVGQAHSAESDDEVLLTEDLLADEETQRSQLQRVLDAFSMNLTPSRGAGTGMQQQAQTSKTIAERMNETFKVSTINDKTKELLSEFVTILKDIQNGVPLAGHDLLAFFEKHTSDLKAANDSVPSFIKTLVLKLLPISAIPSFEELSKPGALMGLIKGVLQVLKTRFPAFVGGSVLTVMAVVVVMLGLFYAFRRGREEREAQENPAFSHVTTPGVPNLDRGRQVEISVDGVRYVTVLDQDGMRIPCPEDERSVYWDGQP